MDRVLPKKRWTTKRLMTIGGITALVLLIVGAFYFTSGKSRVNVEKDRLQISEVKKGIFQETIPVNGVVMPLTTIYLDATEAGRVEERYVEDGTLMKKGQPILRLSNTNLELSLASQETGVFTLLSQMQLSRINAQQNTVSKLNQMADVESSFKEAERIYNLDKRLYAQKVIGSQEFKQAENNYNYYLQKEKLTREILRQDTVSSRQQSEQDKESYEHAQNGLAIMRKKVGDLVLRAPIDGQLTSLDAEVGQSKHEGDRLGQIDMLDGYKVRVDIDEHYISRIFLGLMGDFSFADTTYKLKIIKVFTQVTNGRFQVDMQFVGKEPKGIRRGQTLQITLALSDAKTAIMIPKGGFYQQTGGNWIFKVSEDGKSAYRTEIQLGQQSTDFYEVLSGLNPGDKVVTSSYDTYDKMQILVFKE
ncbi:MAG: HlyD family efflux transporter periplasmic adaptor subunit [Bacteroidota bacterium]|nr:HlyD family efflux transporter periplasmic adaptor subunit [Bacteroidota bacterium]MDP4215131.1 HlyD family efflux transporter periplasmic adaptor subunit [Bacteroidota bacterium]MDP4247666.1 HlyD family efflux transporter periplasmic adaptor subunit [Bacteroidota bacterium]MDP4254325.1 HlyD family efflux transporter periplasmic adaptor subunit [Bacteroidota bacterium]MDP4258797.1 HlyD family efflux transporter periplasmic adaptor subunit [Bacteroidota bacterium]